MTLPCGAILRNRISKAAMTEGLADPDDRASEGLATLYGRWSDGGAGLLLTGNVMVDRRYLERPGNVVIDGNGGEAELRSWASAGTRSGNHLWMQISHPGRQCTRMSSSHPVSPSSEKLQGMMGLIAPPRALEVDEIYDIIGRFAEVAKTAKDTGFTGVQIHSAHGYLSSQFLSPRANKRTDEWGGSLENRARFLLETYAAVRAAVGSDFPIAVKLNSADFQKGGFSKEESARVAGWLAERGLDLLEISGGTYEQMALLGRADASVEAKAESTRQREAYFLEYARDIRKSAEGLPLMVTGGFRTPQLMRDVLDSGEVDLIGIARPFCVAPDFARELLAGGLEALPMPEKEIRLGPGFFGRASSSRSMRTLNGQAEVAWFYRQIIAMSEGREPDLSVGTWSSLLVHFAGELRRARRRTFAGG
jgi:2,4-dienoyl-CoA reductase-like NADH-dependent reductase (Old Yellow Enzyme family)